VALQPSCGILESVAASLKGKTEPCYKLDTGRQNLVTNWILEDRIVLQTGYWKTEPCYKLDTGRQNRVANWILEDRTVLQTGYWKTEPCYKLDTRRLISIGTFHFPGT